MKKTKKNWQDLSREIQGSMLTPQEQKHLKGGGTPWVDDV